MIDTKVWNENILFLFSIVDSWWDLYLGCSCGCLIYNAIKTCLSHWVSLYGNDRMQQRVLSISDIWEISFVLKGQFLILLLCLVWQVHQELSHLFHSCIKFKKVFLNTLLAVSVLWLLASLTFLSGTEHNFQILGSYLVQYLVIWMRSILYCFKTQGVVLLLVVFRPCVPCLLLH